MAYPKITQPDENSPSRLTLCLTRTDCTLLLPMVKKALGNATRRVDAWRKRMKERPPTDKLMNELMKAEEEQNELKELFRHLDALALLNDRKMKFLAKKLSRLK